MKTIKQWIIQYVFALMSQPRSAAVSAAGGAGTTVALTNNLVLPTLRVGLG